MAGVNCHRRYPYCRRKPRRAATVAWKQRLRALVAGGSGEDLALSVGSFTRRRRVILDRTPVETSRSADRSLPNPCPGRLVAQSHMATIRHPHLLYLASRTHEI